MRFYDNTALDEQLLRLGGNVTSKDRFVAKIDRSQLVTRFLCRSHALYLSRSWRPNIGSFTIKGSD
jgi:hypothetical protein